MPFDTSSLVPIAAAAPPPTNPTPSAPAQFDLSSLQPIGDSSDQNTDTGTLPDRVPTLGQVGQQLGYGVLQAIPHAVEGVGDMLEKGTMQGFTDPVTGESLFSKLGRDIGINNSPPPAPAPYVPHVGSTVQAGLNAVGLNPDNLPAPQSGPERIANMVGEGAALAVTPELGGLGNAGLLSKIASLGRAGAVGGLSGGAGQTATEVAPEPLKPVAGIVGALAGGLGAEGVIRGAGKAAEGAGNFLAPLTKGGQEAAAGKTLANAADATPAELISTIDTAQREIVPGSKPRTAELTGDYGLSNLDRAVQTQDPAAFSEFRANQNAARVNALNNIQSEGHPEAVASLIRQQADDLDQQAAAATTQAQQAAGAAVDQFGAAVPAEAAGNQARNALQAQLDASKAQESQLWKAVDPDNSLSVVTSPVKRAVQNVYGDISPELATGVTPAETALANVVNEYGPVLPFQRLTDLRSVVSQAMRAAKSPIQPNDMAYGRLSQLRGAIEDAISDSVQGKVAQEQQAVAAGTMAPENTIGSRMLAESKDWVANNAQATARASGSDGAPDYGVGRSSAVSGSHGAEVPNAGGPRSGPGTPGLSSDAGSGPLVDQAAADRLATASDATKARKTAFGTKPVADILRRPGATYPYNASPEQVASTLWRPGPAGGANIRAVAAAAKSSPDAIEAIRNTAASSLRSKGPLTPESLAKWKAQHADALNALEEIAPGAKARFADIENATDNLATIARQHKAEADAVQKSALGRVLKVSDPEDVTRTVGAIFGRNDAVHQMKQLADAVRGDPVAFEGLRKAAIDYMQGKLISNTEAGTSGQNLIKSDQFQSFLGKNHVALRQVFSDEEINSMRAIAQDLKRANRSITAVKLPGRSNTAQDLSAVGKHPMEPTLLNKLVQLASEGGASAVGSLFGPIGAAGGYVGAHVLGSMRAAGVVKINDLIRDAMSNPDLARALLMKAPKRVGTGSEVTLAHRLMAPALVGGVVVNQSATKDKAKAAP